MIQSDLAYLFHSYHKWLSELMGHNQSARISIWERLSPRAPSCLIRVRSYLQGALFRTKSSKFIVFWVYRVHVVPVNSGTHWGITEFGADRFSSFIKFGGHALSAYQTCFLSAQWFGRGAVFQCFPNKNPTSLSASKNRKLVIGQLIPSRQGNCKADILLGGSLNLPKPTPLS